MKGAEGLSTIVPALAGLVVDTPRLPCDRMRISTLMSASLLHPYGNCSPGPPQVAVQHRCEWPSAIWQLRRASTLTSNPAPQVAHLPRTRACSVCPRLFLAVFSPELVHGEPAMLPCHSGGERHQAPARPRTMLPDPGGCKVRYQSYNLHR
jgi:hypothetical protein